MGPIVKALGGIANVESVEVYVEDDGASLMFDAHCIKHTPTVHVVETYDGLIDKKTMCDFVKNKNKERQEALLTRTGHYMPTADDM